MNQLLSLFWCKLTTLCAFSCTSYYKTFLAGCLLVLGSLSLSLAQPTLVKDINSSQINAGLQPKGSVNINGIVYFSAYDPTNGRELWRSDGTPDGTFMIKDVTPGAAGSNPENLTNVNGTLYFVANKVDVPYDYEDPTNNGNNGYELWKSDGTAAGTVKVKHVPLGQTTDSYFDIVPVTLINANGTLYFTANNSLWAYELWKSNGTTQGTVLVREIGLNQEWLYSRPKLPLISVNNIVYFAATDGVDHSYEHLWKTDGTAAGTIKLASPNVSVISDYMIEHLTKVGNSIYFTAYNGNHGNELWKSNGTSAGTVMVKDIDSGSASSFPRELTDVNGTLFFTANNGVNGNELWKSDGTAAGTVLVKDINIGLESTFPQSLTNINGSLFFTAHNSISGYELWKSNGTSAGTVMVKDIYSGSANSDPRALTDVNGTLFFTANNGVNGNELWKSDGTAAGTVLVKDINIGLASTTIYNLTSVNGLLFFNGMGQLWKSNGTEAGTISINNSGTIASTDDSNPTNFTNINGTIFFTVWNSYPNHQLWKTDGTATGTVLVKEIREEASSLTNVNGTLFFILNVYDKDGILTSYDLWKSNGSSEGTTFIKSFSSANGPLINLTNVNGTLYFTSSNSSSNKYELWKSNGTSAGTVVVKDFISFGNQSNANLTAVNNSLFFTANDGVNGSELWKSDGTTAGTVIVKDINSGGAGSALYNFINYNGTLYFQGRNPRGLWKSDGTAAGTVLVNSLGGSDSRYEMINANGTLYFTSYNNTNGHELWKSNGTTAGTLLVKKFGQDAYLYDLTNVNGVVYFTSSGKLWKSNGTDATTMIVKEVAASNLIGAGNILVFTNNDGTLWRSNGTSAGTEQVSYLKTREKSIQVNNTIFFSASDGKIGFELWKYTPGTCTTSTTNNLAVQGSTVCSGSNGTITIKASQAGVSYQAYINNSAIGNPVKGGGDINLTIPAISLSAGTSVYTIQASGCNVATLTNTATITVNDCPPANCTATGSILREYWANVAGNYITAIPLHTTPTSSSQVTSFQGPVNVAENYGARYRGYICAPATGSYTFYISGDDNSELYLSTDDNAANKRKIASVPGSTGVKVWNKYSTQKSATISLQAGKKYYIEALHKEGLGSDNLAVGWTVPGSSSIVVIPGSVLSPFVPTTTNCTASGTILREYWSNITGNYVTAIPVNSTPTSTSQVTSFQGPVNVAENYGARYRGYICAPATGSYTFYISGDDNSELYLSTDDQPATKTRIASVPGSTGVKVWNKYSTQKSAVISLQADKKYYVEVLHKEGLGGDNLAVGWTVPGSSSIVVIPGSVLSPFVPSANARLANEQTAEAIHTMSAYPNPFADKLTIALAGVEGKLTITLTDVVGREQLRTIKQVSREQQALELDFSSYQLKAGVYVLRLQAEDGKRKVIRVIKN